MCSAGASFAFRTWTCTGVFICAVSRLYKYAYMKAALYMLLENVLWTTACTSSFLRLITGCWDPNECLWTQELSYQWQKIRKKRNFTTTTTVTKFKYLLQSGLQQQIACPHLFAPCRRISQHASAGCFWSSNHQLNPADKVEKSGYNYFLMSAKHHYHMKDTVTNGFILHWLMKTFVMQAVAY